MKPYYEQDGITIYHGDCLEVLPTLPTGSIDCVVTDPPYGLGEKWKRKSHGGNGASRLWSGDVPAWDRDCPHESIATVVVFAREWIVWGSYKTVMPKGTGVLVWDKIQATDRSEGEAAQTNAINGVRFFRMSRIDAYVNKAIFRKEHPCEKPVQLMEWCLSFLPEGCNVLDPFVGSGTTLVAAKRSGRRAIGIEIEERYCEIAARRLSQGVLPFTQAGVA